MDEPVTHDAYLEVAQSGKWTAYILDLPGCFAYGSDEQQALTALTNAIPAYYAWLRAHDDYTPEVRGPWRVVPRETVRAHLLGEHEVGALFACEEQPTDDEELDWRLALLEWAYADLEALLRRMPAAAMEVQSPAGGWSLRQIVDHVAQAQLRYVAHLEEPFTPPSIEQMPGPSVERLRQVHAACVARLRATTDLQRTRVLEERGERWSLRKVLRRSIWHVRDHTAQVERVVRDSGIGSQC